MTQVIVALFAVYAVVTLVFARRAIAAEGELERLRAARNFLAVVSLGVPLLVALILVAL